MAPQPFDGCDHRVVHVLSEVHAQVELAPELSRGLKVVEADVLSQRYQARREPRVEVLRPLAEHLPLPPGGVPESSGA